jgi:hypothetical protein
MKFIKMIKQINFIKKYCEFSDEELYNLITNKDYEVNDKDKKEKLSIYNYKLECIQTEHKNDIEIKLYKAIRKIIKSYEFKFKHKSGLFEIKFKNRVNISKAEMIDLYMEKNNLKHSIFEKLMNGNKNEFNIKDYNIIKAAFRNINRKNKKILNVENNDQEYNRYAKLFDEILINLYKEMLLKVDEKIKQIRKLEKKYIEAIIEDTKKRQEKTKKQKIILKPLFIGSLAITYLIFPFLYFIFFPNNANFNQLLIYLFFGIALLSWRMIFKILLTIFNFFWLIVVILVINKIIEIFIGDNYIGYGVFYTIDKWSTKYNSIGTIYEISANVIAFISLFVIYAEYTILITEYNVYSIVFLFINIVLFIMSLSFI